MSEQQTINPFVTETTTPEQSNVLFSRRIEPVMPLYVQQNNLKVSNEYQHPQTFDYPEIGGQFFFVQINVVAQNAADANDAISHRVKWLDRDYRQSYMEASIEQGVAWQIRANRKKRHLSQEKLAEMLGTNQSAISRIEDPDYGKHSIDTLIGVAHAFDCALSVKFIPYSELARESENLSEEDLFAAPFSDERQFIGAYLE